MFLLFTIPIGYIIFVVNNVVISNYSSLLSLMIVFVLPSHTNIECAVNVTVCGAELTVLELNVQKISPSAATYKSNIMIE